VLTSVCLSRVYLQYIGGRFIQYYYSVVFNVSVGVWIFICTSNAGFAVLDIRHCESVCYLFLAIKSG
jgi:hypothetical protein